MSQPTKEGSTIRRESASHRRRRLRIPNGHCTWCRKPVTKPARHWCSDEACLDAFRMANDPAYIREKAFERDAGICAMCGNHPLEAERLWYFFREMAALLHDAVRQFELSRWIKTGIRPSGGGAMCNCVWHIAAREAADLRKWEADHILPVVEGGGQLGLDNYRTLCRVCHKKQTKELAARRAAARKIQKSSRKPR